MGRREGGRRTPKLTAFGTEHAFVLKLAALIPYPQHLIVGSSSTDVIALPVQVWGNVCKGPVGLERPDHAH